MERAEIMPRRRPTRRRRPIGSDVQYTTCPPFIDRETFVGERRAGDVATQAFEGAALAKMAHGAGMDSPRGICFCAPFTPACRAVAFCQRNGRSRSSSSEVNSSKTAERRPSPIVVFLWRHDSCRCQECRDVTNGLASRDRAQVRPVNDNPLPTLLQADARPCTLCHFNAVILQRAGHILPSEVCRRRPFVNSNQGLAALCTHRRLTAIAIRCAANRRSLRSPCGERRGPRHGSMRPAVRERNCPHI